MTKLHNFYTVLLNSLQKLPTIFCVFAFLLSTHTQASDILRSSSENIQKAKARRFSTPELKLKRWSRNKDKKALESNIDFPTLQANLQLQQSQIPMLEAYVDTGSSKGILFRSEDLHTEQTVFFQSLQTIYATELKLLPQLEHLQTNRKSKLGKKAGSVDGLPDFVTAYQDFFKTLREIFINAENNITLKLELYKQFSPAFLEGNAVTTKIKPDSYKRDAEVRDYSMQQITGMIKEAHTQVFFFSRTVPIFRAIFEQQIMMRRYLNPFFNVAQQESMNNCQWLLPQQQNQFRETLQNIVNIHIELTGLLNSVFYGHNQNPILYNETLATARFFGRQTYVNVAQLLEGHPDKDLEHKALTSEQELEVLLDKIQTHIIDPEEGWQSATSTLEKSSSAEKTPKSPKRERRKKAKKPRRMES